jgi:O-antigen/teichoic acid export membrane protein
LCGAAHPAALFFREPRLEHIAYVLAVGLFFDGLVNVRIVNFRREMRFDREFRFMATRRMVALVITIVAALILRNEWALAIGTVSSRATGLVMSYVMIREWPRFTLSRRAELLGKSSWLFLSNVVLFARQRAAEFTIGRVVGATSVGAYLLASDLANTLSQELVSPINRVALPDLAAQDTPQGIARRFDLLTGQLALILTPLCFGLSACADPVVGLLFGVKWMASVDVLRILAIAGWVAGIASNIGVGFLGLGLYRANAALHAIGAATLLPLLVTGAHLDGARGAALAVLAANLVTVLASLVVSRRVTQYGMWAFVQRIARPVLASAGMYAVILWLGSVMPDSWPIALRLAGEVVVGGVAYLAFVAALFAINRDADAAERLIFKILGQLLQRFRNRPA